MPPLQKASQMRSIWLRSSPVSSEAAVVPGAMVELGVAGGGAVDAAAGPGAGGWGRSAWRWIYPRRLQPSARALHTLGGTQGHHLALELLQVLIADGLSCLVLQGCADLVVRDPAAVLRDQGDQVVDEVSEVGHRSGLETLGWGSGKQSLGLGQDQGLDGLTMTG
jgi:hypothetical protein